MVDQQKSHDTGEQSIAIVTQNIQVTALVPLNVPSLTSQTSAAVVLLLQTSIQGGYSDEMEEGWDKVLANASTEDLRALAHANIWPKIREKIYFHPRTPLDAKYFILQTFSPEVQFGKNRKKRGNNHWIIGLVDSTDDPGVIEALAENPADSFRAFAATKTSLISRALADKLSRDTDPHTRATIAKHTNYEELVHVLLRDRDKNVAIAASKRDCIHTPELEEVFLDGDRILTTKEMLPLLKKIDLSAKAYRKILGMLDTDINKWNEDVLVQIFTHPKTSNQFRVKHWKRLNEVIKEGFEDIPF